MKILQINSVYGVGSTGRIMANIHRQLLNEGHDSYVAYGRKSNGQLEKSIRIGSRIDIYIHGLISRVLDLHGFGSRHATRRLIKKIDIIKPDLIHIHNLHGYYINIEILFEYIKKKEINVVWTLHDSWGFTGHCAYFDFVNCDKWKSGCYSCPAKKNYPKSIIVDNSKINYNKKKNIFQGVKKLTLITPSKWLSQLLEQSFLKGYSKKVINNGIDLSKFKPTRSDLRSNYSLGSKFIILGVASVWDDRKGLDFFLKLNCNLKKDEVIVLVGLSEKQKKNMPEGIISISRTNSIEELAGIYSDADVFINPTLEDNFPTTNLESLSCGTPVITFNTGGSPESINDSIGIVTMNKTIDDIRIAIDEVKKNGKQYYSKNCVKQATLKYDMNIKNLDYLELYESIISKK